SLSPIFCSIPSSNLGRGDYRNGGDQDRHPSGAPRHGRGHGQGGRGNDRQDSDRGSQKWGSKDGDDAGGFNL
ncbi:Hypothetical predicted protein, partial [Olea europaea subsp. europaea]